MFERTCVKNGGFWKAVNICNEPKERLAVQYFAELGLHISPVMHKFNCSVIQSLHQHLLGSKLPVSLESFLQGSGLAFPKTA